MSRPAKKSHPPKPSPYNLEAVRAAAAGHWPLILSQICGIPLDALDPSREHPCPKCGGTTRFRMVDPAAGALFCNHCFNRKNGDGFSAVQHFAGKTFPEAIRLVADWLGIKPGQTPAANGQVAADPAESLEWVEWDETTVEIWGRIHKSPIASTAVRAVGGQLARHRKLLVIALPIWGPQLDAAPPVGWTIYNASGGTLPAKQKGGETQQVKSKNTYGSRPGIITDLKRLKESAVIWKVEGPTDALALLSTADLPSDTTVVTNSSGTNERPAEWVTRLFADKTANVIHDADIPGEDGAKHWSEAIASHAATCRRARLPYMVEKSHGRDLRDFLNEGRSYADLLPLVDPIQVSPSAPTGPAVVESVDDPHRLGRHILDSRYPHPDRHTLCYYREQWWANNSHYNYLESRSGLQSAVVAACKKEFDRAHKESIAMLIGDEEPKPAFKVTRHLVNNVLQAMASMTQVDDQKEMPFWIGSNRPPGHLIAMKNHLFALDQFLAGAEENNVLLPLTPKWFSAVGLDYSFDAAAECPRWLAFLDKNLEGDPDRIAVLQEWAGYCLTDNLDETKFLILVGEGANGKSVFLAGLEALLGFRNCSHIPMEGFAERFHLFSTLGKLANICGDVGEIDRIAEGHIKTFTDGNPMFFDRKGLSPVEAKPTAKLVMACNTPPRFGDKSSGIWRRMIVVPWEITVAESDRVKGMKNHGWWEDSGELPGIFLWAIRGLARLREQGHFTESAKCNTAAEEYRADCNPARTFLQQNVAANPGGYVVANDLYMQYKSDAESSGYTHFVNEKTLGKEVKRLFPGVVRRYGGGRGNRFWFYEGISITSCVEEETNDRLF